MIQTGKEKNSKKCSCIKQIYEVWRRPNLQQLRNWFIRNMLLSGWASLREKISYEGSHFQMCKGRFIANVVIDIIDWWAGFLPSSYDKDFS